MTARVLRLIARDHARSPLEERRLVEATEWLCAEEDGDVWTISSMRDRAWRELECPRSEMHVIWATTFLNETEDFAHALEEFDRARARASVSDGTSRNKR